MPEAQPNNRFLVLLGSVAVIVVAGVVAYALVQKPPPPPPVIAVAASTPSAPPTAAPSFTPEPEATPAAMAGAGASPAAADVPPWESRIDNVLQSDVSETQMAQILIGMLPTLPEDGQVEAASHITNLLPDADYHVLKPLLMNASLPESVQSVLFSDLMNRDDDTKLHAFLEIAQMPNHPFHDEALSDLQIYVGDDYGTDWTKWGSAVDQYLKASNTP